MQRHKNSESGQIVAHQVIKVYRVSNHIVQD